MNKPGGTFNAAYPSYSIECAHVDRGMGGVQ